jgi:hypothetical protein
MDSSTSGILAVIGIVVSVGGAILGVINHSRIRSNCFGKKLEVSLDIDKTSPTKDSPAIERSLSIKKPLESV